MAVRLWLHDGHDGEPGVVAWAPDLLGFSTWAASESELSAKLPGKLAEYAAWRARHRAPIGIQPSEIEISGRLRGNEIVFPPDLDAARPEDIELTIHLLAASRADVTALLCDAPSAALDWDPPYRRFAPWADWRTIRANLAHVANGETHYYTRNIGHQPTGAPVDSQGDWTNFLPRSRTEAVAFLERLKSSADLRRVRTIDHGFGAEEWSVRKALRRLVSHELLHAKSIARIIRDYRALHTDG